MKNKFTEDEDISSQIDKFELKSIGKKWSPEQYYAYLVLSCPDDLILQLRAKRPKDPDKMVSDAKNHIIAYFEERRPKHVIFESFIKATPYAGEKAQDFHSRCHSLINRAKPGGNVNDYDFIIKDKPIESSPQSQKNDPLRF